MWKISFTRHDEETFKRTALNKEPILFWISLESGPINHFSSVSALFTIQSSSKTIENQSFSNSNQIMPQVNADSGKTCLHSIQNLWTGMELKLCLNHGLKPVMILRPGKVRRPLEVYAFLISLGCSNYGLPQWITDPHI